jgi:hypothetical protein
MTDATALAHIKAMLSGTTFPSSDQWKISAAILMEEVEALSPRLASAERERDEARRDCIHAVNVHGKLARACYDAVRAKP